MTRSRSILAPCCTAAAALALLAAPCAAQDENPNAPRQPSVRHLTSAWVGYLAMGLVAGSIVAVSLMGSKRSQQKD